MSKEVPSQLDYTIPLFVQHPFMLTGRDDKIVSASGTFVKFQGRHYVVTCGHVLKQVLGIPDKVLAIMIGNSAINLSSFDASGIVHSARIPEADWAGKDVDIAISSIEPSWPIIADKKHKKAVDLDNWTEPDWDKVRRAAACGWLNNYKSMTETDVATQGVTVVANLASGLTPAHPEFTLHSPEGENAETMLSGISGGLIVADLNDQEVPIGIVFEGFPGEADTLGDRGPGMLFQPGDLMVRGHVLSPETFSDWLQRLKT